MFLAIVFGNGAPVCFLMIMYLVVLTMMLYWFSHNKLFYVVLGTPKMGTD